VTDNIRQNRPLYSFDSEQDAKEKWSEVSARVREEFSRGKIEPLC
jgi:salicylate hydroxylase